LKGLLVASALLLAAAPRFFSPAQSAPPQASNVWDGVYTEAQAKRGQALGMQYCAGCHGIDLNSGEPGPWLFGSDFARRYDAHTMEDLVRRLNTMPPDNPGGFGPEAMADFAAFVLWSNEFPAGPRDLPSEAAALRRIRITVKKP
jgi:mono/diheme cytochrome c family protein